MTTLKTKLDCFDLMLTLELRKIIDRTTIANMKEYLSSGYEQFVKGELDCLLSCFMIIEYQPRKKMSDYWSLDCISGCPFISEQFTRYDFECYYYNFSWYDRKQDVDEESSDWIQYTNDDEDKKSLTRAEDEV